MKMRTRQQQWSTKIAHRRLRFFGHVARLPENAPAKQALYESIRKTKTPRGRPDNSHKCDKKTINRTEYYVFFRCNRDSTK